MLRKCLPQVISILREQSIDSTAAFSGRASTFRLKYILNEIQGMTLVVLYKHLNFTVDKLLVLEVVQIILINIVK